MDKNKGFSYVCVIRVMLIFTPSPPTPSTPKRDGEVQAEACGGRAGLRMFRQGVVMGFCRADCSVAEVAPPAKAQ